MQDYLLNRCTRRCHHADRPLESGERFYSVVLRRGAQLARLDFSEQAWHGPPDDCIGWWKSRMPTQESRKLTPAPVHVLLETLTSLADHPKDASLAYTLAVLLMRRRVLVESSETRSSLSSLKPHDDNETHLHLTYTVDGTEYLVPNCPPIGSEIDCIQEKLIQLLYCEEAPEEPQ